MLHFFVQTRDSVAKRVEQAYERGMIDAGARAYIITDLPGRRAALARAILWVGLLVTVLAAIFGGYYVVSQTSPLSGAVVSASVVAFAVPAHLRCKTIVWRVVAEVTASISLLCFGLFMAQVVAPGADLIPDYRGQSPWVVPIAWALPAMTVGLLRHIRGNDPAKGIAFALYWMSTVVCVIYVLGAAGLHSIGEDTAAALITAAIVVTLLSRPVLAWSGQIDNRGLQVAVLAWLAPVLEHWGVPGPQNPVLMMIAFVLFGLAVAKRWRIVQPGAAVLGAIGVMLFIHDTTGNQGLTSLVIAGVGSTLLATGLFISIRAGR